MITSIAQPGSLPTLERLLQFSGARHRLIAHNIANLSTPNFRPVDVDPAEFHAAMRDAIADREQRNNPVDNTLRPRDTRNIRFSDDGMSFDPQPSAEGVMFHDGNDRQVERIMQDLVENFMMFRVAADLVRSRFTLINQAIAARV